MIKKVDKMDKKRDLMEEWLEVEIILNELVKKAIAEGDIINIKTMSNNIKDVSISNIEILFKSGSNLEINIIFEEAQRPKKQKK